MQIRISDAQQCQTISAIVAITVLIIAFTIAPVSTIGNVAESAKIHCYYVTIQRHNDTDIIFRLDDIICNHRRNEQCVVARRNMFAEGKKTSPRKELIQRKKINRDRASVSYVCMYV